MAELIKVDSRKCLLTATMKTPDKWSCEEVRTTPRGILNFKPYDSFGMFAVFLWVSNECTTLYDGPDEAQAREIFEKCQ